MRAQMGKNIQILDPREIFIQDFVQNLKNLTFFKIRWFFQRNFEIGCFVDIQEVTSLARSEDCYSQAGRSDDQADEIHSWPWKEW